MHVIFDISQRCLIANWKHQVGNLCLFSFFQVEKPGIASLYPCAKGRTEEGWEVSLWEESEVLYPALGARGRRPS